MEKAAFLLGRVPQTRKAVLEFPDDVVAAAQAAAFARSGFEAPADPTAEPWAPMCPPAP